MEITKKDKFWMNFKLYHLWRFIVLNIKILTAVDHTYLCSDLNFSVKKTFNHFRSRELYRLSYGY